MVGVNISHGLGELILGSNEISALVTPYLMNCSSNSDETMQAIDKGVRGHVIQHLNMDGSATETGKEKSIPLV